MGKYRFTVRGNKTFLNDKPILIRGLRCSNGLYSEQVCSDLIGNLKVYAEFGLNAVSVFFMGNRFGNVKGYRRDATLDPVHSGRRNLLIRPCRL